MMGGDLAVHSVPGDGSTFTIAIPVELPESERSVSPRGRIEVAEPTVVDVPNEGGDSSTVSTSQVELLATTGEVPARVAERLEFGGNPAELAAQVTVNFELETGALRQDGQCRPFQRPRSAVQASHRWT